MNFVFLATIALGSTPCFEVHHASGGWKQIMLSPEMAHLSAPEGFSQFRSSEPVKVVDDRVDLFMAGHERRGKTAFDLDLGKGAKSVTLVFKEPLRGAKVDVTGWGTRFMREERIASNRVTVSWADRAGSELFVTVHNHLREPPVLMEVHIVRSLLPPDLGLPLAYSAPRSLFYFVPFQNQTIQLCKSPLQQLAVSRRALESAEPTPGRVNLQTE